MEGLSSKWAETQKMTLVKQVLVYKGPPLPFKKGNKIYLALSSRQRHRDLYGEISVAMGMLCGEERNDFRTKKITEIKMYTAPPHPDSSFYFVVIKLIPLTGKLVCSQCRVRPLKRHYTSAYYAVPLNEDVWDEWICPNCQNKKC